MERMFQFASGFNKPIGGLDKFKMASMMHACHFNSCPKKSKNKSLAQRKVDRFMESIWQVKIDSRCMYKKIWLLYYTLLRSSFLFHHHVLRAVITKPAGVHACAHDAVLEHLPQRTLQRTQGHVPAPLRPQKR